MTRCVEGESIYRGWEPRLDSSHHQHHNQTNHCLKESKTFSYHPKQPNIQFLDPIHTTFHTPVKPFENNPTRLQISRILNTPKYHLSQTPNSSRPNNQQCLSSAPSPPPGPPPRPPRPTMTPHQPTPTHLSPPL
ncbi:hypothetical protein BDV12DRAFT_174254 [Aspergillus spectabilis]